MVEIIHGDLLLAQTDIVAHQVNCLGAFNSGVAKAIRESVPEVYSDYKWYCGYHSEHPVDMLGTVRFCVVDRQSGKPQTFASMFAQYDYGRGKQYTSIKDFQQCLVAIREWCEEYGYNSVAMPYKIGCVRGGANWDDVKPLIDEVLHNLDVELWKLDRG